MIAQEKPPVGGSTERTNGMKIFEQDEKKVVIRLDELAAACADQQVTDENERMTTMEKDNENA